VMDSISIHEAKGRGKGTKKSREVIKLEAVFHSGPRVRIATCQSVTLHDKVPTDLASFRAVELPSTITSPMASCAPGIRRPACPDPSP
jgi:hypothetical protein